MIGLPVTVILYKKLVSAGKCEKNVLEQKPFGKKYSINIMESHLSRSLKKKLGKRI